jgi:hypothetical protein
MSDYLRRNLQILIFVTLAFFVTTEGSADQIKVLILRGTIVNSSDEPLPGCIVSVVSHFARSEPAFSEADGSFKLQAAIPAEDDPQAGKKTYLEVYWNRILKFRQPLASLTITNVIPANLGSAPARMWEALLHDGGAVWLEPINLGK